jgi:hypothetical protein
MQLDLPTYVPKNMTSYVNAPLAVLDKSAVVESKLELYTAFWTTYI